MRARGQMYFWQEKQPFNWNKVCIVLARLMSFISVNKRIFQGLALHTVTHIPSRRFPRTCNRRTLIEFLCRVTWPSVAIIRSSPWPVTSARDLSRPSGPSETGESALFLSFNKSSDFRSHRSASERSCRGRTALITEITKQLTQVQQKTNAWGFVTNIWIWSRGSSSRQDWTLAKETEILYGKPLGFIYKLLYGQYSATDSCNNTQFSADSTSYNTLKQ